MTIFNSTRSLPLSFLKLITNWTQTIDQQPQLFSGFWFLIMKIKRVTYLFLISQRVTFVIKILLPTLTRENLVVTSLTDYERNSFCTIHLFFFRHYFFIPRCSCLCPSSIFYQFYFSAYSLFKFVLIFNNLFFFPYFFLSFIFLFYLDKLFFFL